jgi:hypothetical protein
MSAAPPTAPSAVRIRCEDCARDLGRSAPTLVVAAYETGNWARGSGLRDHWELIALGERRPTRAANTPPPGGGAWNSKRTSDQHRPRGRSVKLTCRKCKRSGWRRVMALYGMAEVARGAGCSDAYLSFL